MPPDIAHGTIICQTSSKLCIVPGSSPLGEFEQLVVLGVLHNASEAYGVPIWRELEERTGRNVSLAAVYKTLDRLESKGLLRSVIGPPSAARGGRSKRVYQITPSGLRLLRASLTAVARMTKGLETLLDVR